MISAAHDLLKTDIDSQNNMTKRYGGKYDCNEISTGAVLLADVLPGLLMKFLISAFSNRISYAKKFIFIVITGSLSFIIVSQTSNSIKWLIFTGICCASVSTSVGELTFLSLTTLYPTNMSFFPYVIGSGTSGLLSSFFYAGLASYFTPKKAILYMLFVPFLMTMAYMLLPDHNSSLLRRSHFSAIKLIDSKETEINEKNLVPFESMGLYDKFKLTKPLLKYMVPLFIIFYSEIIVHNTDVLFLHVIYGFIPSITIVLIITFWEGLIGGGCYVNALNLVSIQIPKIYREFSIGVTTIADTIGIALAGFTALPLHNAICRLGM
ncbi:battenin [Brachionus plicatilis]|uniref:Battenin n=1 Tax=Brachionus plicatilis TaxID=10195 RepID=A0A3M7QYC0_BRAPC|nr:battenin [Brachionus plicatilis]